MSPLRGKGGDSSDPNSVKRMNTYNGQNYRMNSMNVNNFNELMQQTMANFDDSKKNNLD